MATTPWTAGEIANAISGRTAIDLRVDRGPAVNPLAFCCTTNTISDSKDPTCLFAVDVQTGNTDTTFSFDATESFAPDGTIVSYGWDFGDGNSDVGITTSHRYEDAGDYEIVLTITDALGLVRSCAVGVTVDDGLFPVLNDENRRAWVGQLAQASYTLNVYGDHPNNIYAPTWVAVTAGLPAGARVNDISVNPRDADEVVTACGDPNHAVGGGIFRCAAWGGAFADITPANPATWRDPDHNVGGEANRLTANIIALSDAEWDAANWIFCEADRRWDGNVHAIAVVHKGAPSTASGSFYCIYHATTATWEVTQIWTNKNQPWFCVAKRAAVSWVGGQYSFVITDGTNVSWSNEWGRTGTWQDTMALPAGWTLWNDEGLYAEYKGAVWTEYEEFDQADPFDWNSSNVFYLSVNENPYVLRGTINETLWTVSWEAFGGSVPAIFAWGVPAFGSTNQRGVFGGGETRFNPRYGPGQVVWASYRSGTDFPGIPSYGGRGWHFLFNVNTNGFTDPRAWLHENLGAPPGPGEPGHAGPGTQWWAWPAEDFSPAQEVNDVVYAEFFDIYLGWTGVHFCAFSGTGGGWYVGQTRTIQTAEGISTRRFSISQERSGNLAVACYSIDIDRWS